MSCTVSSISTGTCGEHEEYSMGDVCDSTCEDINKKTSSTCDSIEVTEGCMCKPDFYRNEKGLCVSEEECGCITSVGIVIPVCL